MGGIVGAAFGASLERHRDRFNAQFAAARRTTRGLDPAVFKEYLRVCAAPIVEAAAASTDAVDDVAIALYDIGLELVGAELAGPGGRYPVLNRAFVELMPLTVDLFVRQPRSAIGAICNAIHNLSTEPGVDAQAWLDAMLDVSPHCTSSAELLDAGKVLAWRCGMAHYRESAMAVGAGLRPEVAAAVGFDGDEARFALGASATLRIVARLGDFRGFGGPFDSLPQVVQSGGTLFAFDNAACWSIHADRYGATLRRFGRDLPEEAAAPPRYRVDRDGVVELDGYPALRAFDVKPTSFASNAEMVAITLPHSYRVWLVSASAE